MYQTVGLPGEECGGGNQTHVRTCAMTVLLILALIYGRQTCNSQGCPGRCPSHYLMKSVGEMWPDRETSRFYSWSYWWLLSSVSMHHLWAWRHDSLTSHLCVLQKVCWHQTYCGLKVNWAAYDKVQLSLQSYLQDVTLYILWVICHKVSSSANVVECRL